jgi:hypothetical protein
MTSEVIETMTVKSLAYLPGQRTYPRRQGEEALHRTCYAAAFFRVYGEYAVSCRAIIIDLYLLACMACIWMYRDACSKGRSLISLLPYILITAIFVSIGPLLYIVVNGFGSQASRARIHDHRPS